MLIPLVLALASGTAGPSVTPLLQAPIASETGGADAENRLDELTRLLDEAREAQQAGRLEEARALVREALELLEREPVELDAAGIDVVGELGDVAWSAQSIEVAHRAYLRLVRDRERTLPEDHPELLVARGKLALAMHKMGDLAGARVLQEAVLTAAERTLPEDHPSLVAARHNLAVTTRAMGDLAGARALQEGVLAARERTLPEDDPVITAARLQLAITIRRMGDLPEARALQEAALAAYERTLSEDHPSLTRARGHLAGTLRDLGDLAGARALEEAALAACERTLPEGHRELLAARNNLALTLWRMGDLAGARALEEAVLAAYERTLPEDHPDLLMARGNLAVTLREVGDPAGARALEEAVLAARERTLPEDHPDLVRARTNLAVTMAEMGDLAGARALQEAVLATWERTLPEDHPNLLVARANLAVTLNRMGDLAGARALEEAVLAAYEPTLPEDHPDLVAARGNLAVTLNRMGDLEGGRALQEAVLAARERTLPEDHPDLVRDRANLAITTRMMGDLPLARALEEAVLAARERTLPEDHPGLVRDRANLAVTLAGLRAWDELSAETDSLTRGIAARLASNLARSSRAAGEIGRVEADGLSLLHFFTESLDSPAELERGAFETIELARHVRTAGGVLADAGADEELERLRREASTLRGRLNDLLAAEGSGGEDFARLVLERDRIEARLRQGLAATGAFLERIDAEVLAAALPEDAAAIGYWRYVRYRLEGGERRSLLGEDCLLAHVLRKDGSVHCVDLGPMAEVDALVRAWRAAVGKPLERGMALDAPVDDAEDGAARALAERVLAPVLEAVGDEATTLFVCLEDALHLVPLDALPLPGEAEGRLVGEALDLRFEASFARLIGKRARPDGEPALVALGGASFNSRPDTDTGSEEDDPQPELLALATRADRAGPGGQTFGPLRETRYEAENLAELFDELFEREATVLTRKEATKAALAEAAHGTRWLHVATHGYFAPESVKSTADPEPDPDALWSPMTAEERVTGLAPMTLCGLALAGANLGRDSLGRVPGILTAEELAGWDLSACELAVLSACETNVGVTRAGQGIQSLQAALHMAGARASITSLWKVDDELTRRLMEDLYTRLWVNGEPKAEALWNAKSALRRQGAATRDWAGWVLVGDPD